jgi:hypothetical protein
MAEENDSGQERDVGAEVEELKRELINVRKAQAGSDREVGRLKSENAELLKQLEERNGEEQLGEKERELDRRQRILELSMEKGIDPRTALDILTSQDEGDAVDRLSAALTGQKLEAADEFARKNGRTVKEAKLDMAGIGYRRMAEMPNDEFEKLPASAVNRAMENELKSSNTLRSKLEKGGK